MIFGGSKYSRGFFRKRLEGLGYFVFRNNFGAFSVRKPINLGQRGVIFRARGNFLKITMVIPCSISRAGHEGRDF